MRMGKNGLLRSKSVHVEPRCRHRPDTQRLKARRTATIRPSASARLAENANSQVRRPGINPVINGCDTIVGEHFDASFIEEDAQSMAIREADVRSRSPHVKIRSLHGYDNARLTFVRPAEFQSVRAAAMEFDFDFGAVRANTLQVQRFLQRACSQGLHVAAERIELDNGLLS